MHDHQLCMHDHLKKRTTTNTRVSAGHNCLNVASQEAYRFMPHINQSSIVQFLLAHPVN